MEEAMTNAANLMQCGLCNQGLVLSALVCSKPTVSDVYLSSLCILVQYLTSPESNLKRCHGILPLPVDHGTFESHPKCQIACHCAQGIDVTVTRLQ